MTFKKTNLNVKKLFQMLMYFILSCIWALTQKLNTCEDKLDNLTFNYKTEKNRLGQVWHKYELKQYFSFSTAGEAKKKHRKGKPEGKLYILISFSQTNTSTVGKEVIPELDIFILFTNSNKFLWR